MNSLIIYDSLFGNTQKIAETIAEVLNSSGNTKTLMLKNASIDDFKEQNLLIIGSPTHGGQSTPAMQKFLNQIPPQALKNVFVACFDTRFLEKDVNFALRLLIRTIGYAAPKIADLLKSKSGKILTPPEGFIVKGKNGPLKDGELKKAKIWAKQILSQIK